MTTPADPALLPLRRGMVLDGADIGDEQIEALRDEAAAAGDEKQVDLCEKALGGDVSARAACVRVILDARAQG